MLRSWFVVNSVVAGALALIWLVLRTGPKPSRFVYPCQQAAFSAASLAFAAPVISTLVAARRGLVQGMRTPAGVAAAMVGLLVTMGMWGHSSLADNPGSTHATAPADYRAQVFRVTDCPLDPVGDRFPGLDNLLTLMGSQGTKFYRSVASSGLAGPGGIIAADDVVVIKINYQWDERGGSNTDLLRGLIRAIVDHPDTFTGEVVVCENAQFNSVSGFDRADNNAQNTSLSPHDVVVGFQNLGYTVSHYDWTSIRYTEVDEYSQADLNDGYIVYDYDPQISGRVSYPKFQTDDGTFISMRDGIWDPGTSSYDRDSLKFINLPVLKSHHATYGVTACVKHYMGLVTRELSTNSHSAIGAGLLGEVIAEIGLADLNILDCIWVNANPYSGPSHELQRRHAAGSTRRQHRSGRRRHLGRHRDPHSGVPGQRLHPAVAVSRRDTGRPFECVQGLPRQFHGPDPRCRLRRHKRSRRDRRRQLERRRALGGLCRRVRVGSHGRVVGGRAVSRDRPGREKVQPPGPNQSPPIQG